MLCECLDALGRRCHRAAVVRCEDCGRFCCQKHLWLDSVTWRGVVFSFAFCPDGGYPWKLLRSQLIAARRPRRRPS